MQRLTEYPTFLLVAAVVSAAHVEPPTNVTFHCHNLRNVLKWSYEEMVPGLKFRVDIEPYYAADLVEEISDFNPKWVEPQTHQIDLSNLSNPIYHNWGFPEQYTVYVTATVGNNESNKTPLDGISFSYYQNTQSDHKCFLYFPTVNISAEKDNLVSIHFVHPWFLYGARLFDKTTFVPELAYSVDLIGQNTTKKDTCASHSCWTELQLHTPQETYCVKVHGEMDEMAVRTKHKYCLAAAATLMPNNTTKDYTVIAITIAAVIALLGLAFIVCMVYKKKTTANTHLPPTLTFHERLKRTLTLGLTPERVFVPKVDPASPTQLLDNVSDKPESIVLTPDPADMDVRLMIGLPSEGEGAGEEEGAEDAEALASEYMSGRELEDEEEDEEAPSCDWNSADYEKRINATVQLTQDETLVGYRCRRSGENE